MATIYRCDRCNREELEPENIRKINVPAIYEHFYETRFQHTDPDDEPNKPIELCASCFKDLWGWFNSYKRVADAPQPEPAPIVEEITPDPEIPF